MNNERKANLSNERKIDAFNLYLSNFGYENQPLSTSAMKKLRIYASKTEGRIFSSISQLSKFTGKSKIETQRIWVEKYNKQINADREPQKQRKKQESAIINKIKRDIVKLNNGNKDEFKVDLNGALNVFEFKDFLNKLLSLIHTINSQFITLKIGDFSYAINDNTRVRLHQLINNDLIQLADSTQSDDEVIQQLQRADNMIITKFTQEHKNEKHNGAFFKYMNNTTFDLVKFGIFNDVKPEYYTDTCLIYALKQGGLEENKLSEIRMMLKCRNIPLSDLPAICDKVKIQIQISKLDKNMEKDRKHNERNIYGKTYDRIFKVGLVGSHYFIIDKTEITSFAIENYEELKDIEEFNYIYNASHKKNSSRCIDSFKLIRLLLEHKDKLLTPITYENSIIASTQFYKSISDEIVDLEYDVNSSTIRPVNKKEEKGRKCKTNNEIHYENVFFDFETYVNDDRIHIPYLCRTVDKNGNVGVFFGEKCGLNMLYSLKSNTRLIAHNANYDYRFILKHLYDVKELSRGNRLISCKGKFGEFNIHVKDSFHLISMPLRDFPKVFDIKNTVKEVMPYDLYNKETVTNRFVDIDFAKTFLKEEEHSQFMINIDKWKLENGNNTYDIIEYSSRYCELDCIILQQGYNTFRQWMLELVKLDIDEILTIASLAHTYFINEGCYNDVNELGGTPQRFIQKCVVGGRTMCAENKKSFTEGKIQDFDAVSLYPSAMNRMDGFLKGIPKVIINKDYTDLQQKDGYFVEILITNVGIRREFPIVSYKNNAGVRMFSNDVVGKHIFVDKVMLEDMVKFQHIEFEIIKGYYFDEGYNTKIKDTIMFLFEERLRFKKLGNKCEMVYKLIMNSGYGKSIMKAVEIETRVFDDDKKFKTFLSRNYNWIISFNKIHDCNKVKVKSVKSMNEHFNIAHVGVSILSWSKRIMNEVMCLAEDNNIKIYYQDTDSMHIDDDNIQLLSVKFNEAYNKELIGKSMGQFHSDFDFKGCKNVFASRSLFLGKKCYIDELKGEDEITGVEKTSFHIRMKGIPNSCILFATNRLGYSNPFELYQDLFNGKNISFDLTNNGTKCNFKFEKDYSVSTVKIFNRNIKF